MLTPQFKVLAVTVVGVALVSSVVFNEYAISQRVGAVEKQVEGVQSKFLPATLTPKVTVTPTATPSSTLRPVVVTKAPVVVPTK